MMNSLARELCPLRMPVLKSCVFVDLLKLEQICRKETRDTKMMLIAYSACGTTL